jgi:hypothetical protein
MNPTTAKKVETATRGLGWRRAWVKMVFLNSLSTPTCPVAKRVE